MGESEDDIFRVNNLVRINKDRRVSFEFAIFDLENKNHARAEMKIIYSYR